MSDLTTRIIHAVTRPSYSPVKPKVLARRMGVTDDDYPEFRKTVKALIREGRLALGKNQLLRPADPHGTVAGGEGVITEVLGPHGKPGVDTRSIIKGFGLPEAFPAEALAEARDAAALFREDDLHGREDFTGELVVTIDPADARDFDDAVS